MSAQDVKSFDITIPATVTTGTPVDVSAASARPRSLILPAGTGRVDVMAAGKQEGNYFRAASVSLRQTAGDVIGVQQIDINASFGWIRLDRKSGSGELTAQLVGQPSQTGADGRDNPQGQLHLSLSTGLVYAFDTREAVYKVTGGHLVTGGNGIDTDGGGNTSTLDVLAFDSEGGWLGCVGKFHLIADVSGKDRVALTLGNYLSIPAGASLFYKLCTVANAGATIGDGAFIKLF